jgi:hypothetical protein
MRVVESHVRLHILDQSQPYSPSAPPEQDGGVFRDILVPSPVLVVTFGGLARALGGIPPFEFFGILKHLTPAKKLFLCDHHQSWYHRGVRGFADDIKGVENELARAIAELKPTKVVMLGASAGGYAALLFGRLLDATEVHVFGPQTFISPSLRLRYFDYRWPRQQAALLLSGRYQPSYGDLHGLFRRTSAPRETRFVIHYCSSERLDAVHARRLGSYPDVELRAYEEGGHKLVKHLRDSGELQALLQEILAR